MHYPASQLATFPFRLSSELPADEVRRLQEELNRLVSEAPYGWAHTLDLGPIQVDGLLGDNHLRIAGLLDEWQWWPASLEGARVADIGCFSGALSLMMSARGATEVVAVDEIQQHLAQCEWLARTMKVDNVTCLDCSLYDLPRKLAPSSFDVILLSGVLYHLSDMLVGLLALQHLLKEDGVLLIESNAVECFEHSYANFGRFVAGMWWQPTALCIKDMCEFVGFDSPEVRFYTPGRCLARALKPKSPKVPFKRGLNWPSANRLDEIPRSMDGSLLPAAPCQHD